MKLIEEYSSEYGVAKIYKFKNKYFVKFNDEKPIVGFTYLEAFAIALDKTVRSLQ